MAAQARVASAVAVTATSARSQEPSGPVKAYQSAVSRSVSRWIVAQRAHKGYSIEKQSTIRVTRIN